MTRKHFNLIAKAINEVSKDSNTASMICERVATQLAIEFRQINPLFDSARFLKASINPK